MKKRNQTNKVDEILNSAQPSPTDPQGSWTGLPAEETETPVQDADDL